MTAPNNNIIAWLYIEIACFYLYMISTVCYIAYSMFRGVCCGASRQQSDMNKTINDFLSYAKSNLVWFALNFVLFLMPLICVLSLNPNAENLDIVGASQSYEILVIIVCVFNFVQFILRPRIFRPEPKKALA